jgi:DNA repair protein RadD
MAALIHDWYQAAPYVRGCILAHRKELVQQNHAKLTAYLTDCEVGIFSAGLRRKDWDAQILFASIDSIFNRAGDFAPFDFIFVDEAHRIPPSGDGKYRTFIAGCRELNPNIRVVGWTATPFRMGCGPICHKDHVLNEVCYEAGITELIAQGFLCNLRSKVGDATPNLDSVSRNSGGDYIVKSLARATNKGDLVAEAVSEALAIMSAERRKSAVFFCVDVEHCHAVSKALAKHGVKAPCITGKTKQETRDRIVEGFKAKRLHAICCVNVLTEGFDAPHVDTIVLLRPTLSPGLFAQMVGRGLRPDPGKDFCLVLDFADCIDEHGPLDLVGTGQKVVMAVCGDCKESFSRAARVCPVCGWGIPKIEVERLEREEAERRMHGSKPFGRSILSTTPEIFPVDSVLVSQHEKLGSLPSLKVRYRCGLRVFSEWICLDHQPGNYAYTKARSWWTKRFPNVPIPSVAEALNDMFFAQRLADWTKTVTVRREGKYMRVIGYNAELSEDNDNGSQAATDECRPAVHVTRLADFSPEAGS